MSTRKIGFLSIGLVLASFIACSHPSVATSANNAGVNGSPQANAHGWEVKRGPYELQGTFTVAPAPVPGDASDQEDYRILNEWQAKRTPADCERANREAWVNAVNFYAPPVGPLSQKEAEALQSFFQKIQDSADVVISPEKERWARPRPFLRDKNIQPCVPKPRGWAYPSGHATQAALTGRVFAEIFPSRRAAFLQRAQQIALDRVIGGVHHPTDIEAGKLLGAQIFEAMMKNAKFQADLKEAKKAFGAVKRPKKSRSAREQVAPAQ